MQKCHIVAFLHYEKGKNTYFLYFILKKQKISFWEKKGENRS
jgi:hypothetical protein